MRREASARQASGRKISFSSLETSLVARIVGPTTLQSIFRFFPFVSSKLGLPAVSGVPTSDAERPPVCFPHAGFAHVRPTSAIRDMIETRGEALLAQRRVTQTFGDENVVKLSGDTFLFELPSSRVLCAQFVTDERALASIRSDATREECAATSVGHKADTKKTGRAFALPVPIGLLFNK
jgi:hypothetical protein